MNQLDNQKQNWTEDFKIYDEFCEDFFLEPQTQDNVSEDRIYQNLIEAVEGQDVFENIFYVRNEVGQDENEYEIVNVQRKSNRKLRSLKTL